MITGTSASAMELRLQDSDGADICTLDKEEAMLGAYPVVDYLVHPLLRFPLFSFLVFMLSFDPSFPSSLSLMVFDEPRFQVLKVIDHQGTTTIETFEDVSKVQCTPLSFKKKPFPITTQSSHSPSILRDWCEL